MSKSERGINMGKFKFNVFLLCRTNNCNFGEFSQIGYNPSVSKSDLFNFVTFENSPIYLPDLLEGEE